METQMTHDLVELTPREQADTHGAGWTCALYGGAFAVFAASGQWLEAALVVAAGSDAGCFEF